MTLGIVKKIEIGQPAAKLLSIVVKRDRENVQRLRLKLPVGTPRIGIPKSKATLHVVYLNVPEALIRLSVGTKYSLDI